MSTFESKIIQAWCDACPEAWDRYIHHEFVRGMGDGSLPRSAFIAYLIQDYIFLIHFSRAWAMAIVKSDTAEQMRTAAATVNTLINEEIQFHVKICEREGIRETQLLSAQEAPENIAYTRYVMDTGLSGDLLDLLATLTSCVFGYRQIGANLADYHDTTPLYREWIEAYGPENYGSVCGSVATLVDQVCQQKLGDNPERNPRWQSLCQRFETATNLEANFWQMGLRLGKEENS